MCERLRLRRWPKKSTTAVMETDEDELAGTRLWTQPCGGGRGRALTLFSGHLRWRLPRWILQSRRADGRVQRARLAGCIACRCPSARSSRLGSGGRRLIGALGGLLGGGSLRRRLGGPRRLEALCSAVRDLEAPALIGVGDERISGDPRPLAQVYTIVNEEQRMLL